MHVGDHCTCGGPGRRAEVAATDRPREILWRAWTLRRTWTSSPIRLRRPRCAARCAGPATASRSTSPRPPSCSPPAASSSTSCSPRRRRVRDAGLVAEGRPGVVTYSRKVFIPLTRLCRDRCHYCTFATVPHRLPAAFLERDEVLEIARAGRRGGLQGGAVHPRRPAGGALAGGPGVAGGARLRLHAGLRAGLRDRGARGDRAAAAPQPRGAVLGRADPAQAGGAEHGDDAGDHGRPGCGASRAGRITAARTRSPRSGCARSPTPAGSASRSPPGS